MLAAASGAYVLADEKWTLPRVHTYGSSVASQSVIREAGCNIKGNINDRGERIYHMPGQAYYAATRINAARGERWFCSQWEAWLAGWRKSKV
ncbi:hypothetical protein M2281_005147 [Mesorhizobium soli]|jgi:hypothetical protein|nr:hypothetical protein [Mesorhizobium soli]